MRRARGRAFVLAVAALVLPAAAAPAWGQERPTLSGPELRWEPPGGRFLVHYTLEGADAPTELADVDPQNGVPDLLDNFGEGLNHAWDLFVGEDGWPAPPPDEGRGGDDRLDVYVRVIDAFGYTYYEPLAAGGTPHASHLELSNSLAGMGPVTVRSIAAHEFHHALQAALTTQLEDWIFEATATWARYFVYAGDWLLDIARDTLWTLRLQGAGRAFDDTGARFDYAGMIWIKFLLEQGAYPRRTVLDLWQAMAADGDWVLGHEQVLPALGLASVPLAVETFAEWNLFACHRADGHHYTDAAGPACGVEAEVVPTAVTTLPAAGTSVTVGPLGQAYLEFTHDCTTAGLQVHVDGTGPYAARAVAVRGGGLTTSQRADSTGGGVDLDVPDWNNAARAVLILVNLDAQPQSFAYQASGVGAYQAAPDLAATQQVTIVDESGAAPTGPLALAKGQTRQLRALAFFGSCADGLDATATAGWHAADESVANVSAGLVRAQGAGATGDRRHGRGGDGHAGAGDGHGGVRVRRRGTRPGAGRGRAHAAGAPPRRPTKPRPRAWRARPAHCIRNPIMAAIDGLLALADLQGADGLLLEAGKAPVLTTGGTPRSLTMPPLDAQALERLLAEVAPPDTKSTSPARALSKSRHASPKAGRVVIRATRAGGALSLRVRPADGRRGGRRARSRSRSRSRNRGRNRSRARRRRRARTAAAAAAFAAAPATAAAAAAAAAPPPRPQPRPVPRRRRWPPPPQP